MAAPPGTTPQGHQSAALHDNRKQSDLKPLMELEVCGVVFESDDVPSLFFPDHLFPADNVPNSQEGDLWHLIQDLSVVNKEDDAYKPLVAVFSYVVDHSRGLIDSSSNDAGGSDDSDDSSRAPPRAFFIVYTKQMKDKFDGAGHLKPDALYTDREILPKEAVPWCAVRIAIEVKGNWRHGLQQGLTYARSMLEVGDKWYSMVIVYNHLTLELRFCFATRHAVFVTPAWKLTNPSHYAKAATTLIRACNASGSTAGFDLHRARDVEGKTHLILPDMHHSIKLGDPLCRRIHIIGRGTHVYPASLSDSFAGAERDELFDPPEFSQQLEDDPTIHVPHLDIAGMSHPERRVVASPDTPPIYGASPLGHIATALADLTIEPTALLDDAGVPSSPAAPSVHAMRAAVLPPASSTAADSLYALGTWESLCQKAQLHWDMESLQSIGGSEFVVKEAWVSYERHNTEVEVLQAVKGLYGFVEYAGHMVIPHPGMERLAAFGDPPANGTSRRCKHWTQIYPQGEPRLMVRVHRAIFYKTLGVSLITIGGDSTAIANAMKDAATALLLLYDKKHIHRDLSTWNLVAYQKDLKTAASQLNVLKKLFGRKFKKIAKLFEWQHVFLIDFDHAVRWDVNRDHLPSRSGTWAFMAAARLRAWISKARWIDTLIDDLEGAIWSLFYAVLRANRHKLSELEKLHFASFNSDHPYMLAATKHMILAFEKDETGDLSALKETWPLWWRLFRVARGARVAITALKARLPEGKTFADASKKIKAEMDQLYKSTVYDYVEAVGEALKEMNSK
ncbi:hypothetical protein AURDEDRAFT_128171 [Auricularia subglabra TFB-10046 SS5]|uniref:Fungal-type protein kinase domain-containing protein n=1 Tax=Auricularia subglabra (strain TFB-10046 / SS5) TaxID=717982 RepID=J0LIU4_AURST|nr:hypothetical protein AURDEDRAFT_128171 [Auricularia subglabra TFB-10046 SS5]